MAEKVRPMLHMGYPVGLTNSDAQFCAGATIMLKRRHDLYITYRMWGCSRLWALFYSGQTIIRYGGEPCQKPERERLIDLLYEAHRLAETLREGTASFMIQTALIELNPTPEEGNAT